MRDKVGYAVVQEEHTIKKRILLQNTMFIVHSAIMTAENCTPTKNLKTQTIRKMLDHEGPRITLLCVPSHVRIPGNEKADQAAKETLDDDISTIERYPPDDLKK
jgi:hypothetical protein